MPQHRTSEGKGFRAPLACALLAMLLAACGGKAPADNPQKPEPDLTILHVNDSHSFVAGMNDEENYCIDDAECRGGYARIAAEIRRVKAGRDNVLALHAGDSFQGTLLFSVHRWPMLAELDALLPYDAMTPGNHEYDDGCAEFAGYIPKLPYPMLAANIDAQPGSDLDGLGIEPYMIREIGGRKVGVIGLSNDSGAILASACPGMTFTDHEADLKRAVRELRDRGIDRIIALTHLGLSEDRRLARSVDGVDVIVGGHSHSYIGPGSEEGPYPIVEHSPNGDPVLVVTAGYGTRWLGELSVNFDENGAPASWSGEAVPLGRDMPRDPAISAKTAEYGEALETLRKTVVGSHDTAMNDGLVGCREAECFGGLLFTDAMLEFCRKHGARIALLNSGSVRGSLPPGEITRGQILNVFPFTNRIVLREYTGSEILAALEHGVRGEGDEEYAGQAGGPRMLQTAGLRYMVDASRAPGERVVRAEVLDDRGRVRPLEKNARYITALIEYMAQGGDDFKVLTGGKAVESEHPIDSEMLTEYVRRHSPLPKPQTGRLVIVNGK